MEKYNSHLKEDGTEFTTKTNLRDHDLGTQIQGSQNSMFQPGNNFSKFLENLEN